VSVPGLVGGAIRLALAPVRFVGDRVAMRFAGPLAGLEPGHGAIVDVDGRTVAAFRDEDGAVTALSPYCTHLRCVVGFDAAAREWRCPCHGSRFDLNGGVVRGPARRPLERVALSRQPGRTT
jgi:Rieske Fe-S protein